MKRLSVREATVTHVVTGVAVVLVMAVLAAGPRGWQPRVAQFFGLGMEQSDAGETPISDAAADQLASDEQQTSAEHLPAIRALLPSARSGWALSDRDLAPAVEPTPMPHRLTGVPLRVGIQAGHWKNSELPAELAVLKGSTGAMGQGWAEMDVNLDLARRVVALLEQQGVQADLIPATVPSRYEADAFVSIHGDANSNTKLSGYKLARARWSTIPEKDDALLSAISDEYRAATGLPEHTGTITPAMRGYYAFDNRRFEHAVAPTTPAVILETAFLTNANDLKLLREQSDEVAKAIVRGILKFLGS